MLFAALALILAACAQVAEAGPQSGGTPQAGENTEGKCVRDSNETRLLVNVVQGYCVQFPAEYDIAYPNESEITLFKGSMVNVEEPNAHIEVKSAEGVTLEQVADQIASDYAIPGMEVKRTELTIGGEPAIMLDGLSGQDPNRQVVVIHGANLYRFYFMPMVAKESDVYKKVEALYETVIKSFTFRTETNACPDCPEATEPAEPVGAQMSEDPKTAMISGWVWYDTCALGKDGEPHPFWFRRTLRRSRSGFDRKISPLASFHFDDTNVSPTNW